MKLLYVVIFFVLATICLASGCSHSDCEKVQQIYEAACNGNAEAQYILGVCYIKGKGGIEPDAEEAFEWFYKSAEQGYAKAQYVVSRCYEKGDVVEKNSKRLIIGVVKLLRKDTMFRRWLWLQVKEREGISRQGVGVITTVLLVMIQKNVFIVAVLAEFLAGFLPFWGMTKLLVCFV